MAIVLNQQIPTDHIEDQLDPPIEGIDQYRRTLTEGTPIPEAPAGVERVSYTHKGARVARRNDSDPGPGIYERRWREAFQRCLDCWKTFPYTIDPDDLCASGESRGHRPGADWYPQSAAPRFHDWMKRCLVWQIDHPTVMHPACGSLKVEPKYFDFCPGDVINFEVESEWEPTLDSASCGEITDTLQWTAPSNIDDCPEHTILVFRNSWGMKGCAYGTPLEETECCCSIYDTLAIIYQSLIMGCGAQQTFEVHPIDHGCPPYEWVLAGAGTLVPAEDGLTALFTSPETNPECYHKPTIILLDGCDKQAQITLAVNCYTPQTAALGFAEIPCCYITPPDIFGNREFHRDQKVDRWACDGTLVYSCETNPGCTNWGYYYGVTCEDLAENCWTNQCGGNPGASPTCGLVDYRTPEMKTAGCCPLNPLTGLPY